VDAEDRQRLSVSKRVTQMFHVGRCNLMNLNNMEVKKRYWVKISNRFAASENLDGDVHVNRA